MFNPDMPQMSPQSEKDFSSKEKEVKLADMEVLPVAESVLETPADFAKHPENMLPRAGDSLPEGGMEALAGAWAEEMASVRQEEAREVFRKTVADQRAMLYEELLRNEIVNGSASSGESDGDTKLVESFQDKAVSKESGTLGWILEKMNHIPGGKKFIGALALVAGLSAIPKDAEAGFLDDMARASGDIVVQSIRRLPQEMDQQRRMEEQRRMQAQREAQRYYQQMEQLKERYAQDSQRIVDQYDREDANVERTYDNQLTQLLNNGSRGKDDALKQKLSERVEISYHKQKLKAAEVAWNGMNRVKEKYIQISTAGASYQSQVNEAFLKNLQRVAAKEISDLAKLNTEVVSIIPVSKTTSVSLQADVTQEKFPRERKQSRYREQ